MHTRTDVALGKDLEDIENWILIGLTKLQKQQATGSHLI